MSVWAVTVWMLPAGALKGALAQSGVRRVYVGATFEEAAGAAQADAEGRNWWDVLLAGVILLLVVEAVAANYRRAGSADEAVLRRQAGAAA